MPQIIAWQCPDTKKIFADKVKYQSHLRAKARERYEKKTHDAYLASSTQHIRNTLNKAWTIEGIQDWFLDPENARFLLNRLIRLKFEKWHTRNLKPKQIANFAFVHFKFDRIRWSDSCSNSHRCPRDGVTNFDRGKNTNLPTGYPGYNSKITWKTNEDKLWTSIFANTGILTGSGGSQENGYVHEVTLFASDWTNMAVFDKINQ